MTATKYFDALVGDETLAEYYAMINTAQNTTTRIGKITSRAQRLKDSLQNPPSTRVTMNQVMEANFQNEQTKRLNADIVSAAEILSVLPDKVKEELGRLTQLTLSGTNGMESIDQTRALCFEFLQATNSSGSAQSECALLTHTELVNLRPTDRHCLVKLQQLMQDSTHSEWTTDHIVHRLSTMSEQILDVKKSRHAALEELHARTGELQARMDDLRDKNDEVTARDEHIGQLANDLHLCQLDCDRKDETLKTSVSNFEHHEVLRNLATQHSEELGRLEVELKDASLTALRDKQVHFEGLQKIKHTQFKTAIEQVKDQRNEALRRESNLKNELAKQGTQIQNLNSEIATHQATLASGDEAKNKRISELELELAEKSTNLTNMTNLHRDVSLQLEQQNTELQNIRGDVQSRDEELKSLREEAQREVDALQQERTGLQNLCQSRSEQLEDVETENTALLSKLDQNKDTLQSTTEKLQSAKQQYSDAVSDHAGCGALISQLQVEKGKLEYDLQTTKEELEGQVSAANEATKRADDIDKARNSVVQQRDTFTASNSELEKHLALQKVATENAVQDKERLRTELHAQVKASYENSGKLLYDRRRLLEAFRPLLSGTRDVSMDEEAVDRITSSLTLATINSQLDRAPRDHSQVPDESLCFDITAIDCELAMRRHTIDEHLGRRLWLHVCNDPVATQTTLELTELVMYSHLRQINAVETTQREISFLFAAVQVSIRAIQQEVIRDAIGNREDMVFAALRILELGVRLVGFAEPFTASSVRALRKQLCAESSRPSELCERLSIWLGILSDTKRDRPFSAALDLRRTFESQFPLRITTEVDRSHGRPRHLAAANDGEHVYLIDNDTIVSVHRKTELKYQQGQGLHPSWIIFSAPRCAGTNAAVVPDPFAINTCNHPGASLPWAALNLSEQVMQFALWSDLED